MSTRHLPVLPLVDSDQRKISYLRVSLTDRCNYRCTYCLPADGIEWLPRSDVLSFEEIVRLVGVFSRLGVRRVRLTGGEPTVRQNVVELVARLAAVRGIDQLVMTTNGHRLPELAEPLAAAGLAEVNVSIDSLEPQRFAQITRRGDLLRVICGIDAARDAGMTVKLNAVALRGFNDDEIVSLCEWAWARGLVVRFIEHMPMSDGLLYDSKRELSADAIRQTLVAHFGAELEHEDATAHHGPARYWRLGGDPARRVGIISAMSEHFCATCNRVRLTAIGALHTCLAYDDAVDLRSLVRGGAGDDAIEQAIRDAVAGKRPGHEFRSTGAGAPKKHMISIGG